MDLRRAIRSAAALAIYAATLDSISAAHATEENDVVSVRGAAVFSTYCVLCHGQLGKGDGRAASLQAVPPSDLSKSSRSVEYRLRIIGGGGAAMNRSGSMPAWSEVLTSEQIADVAAYLVTLRDAPAAGTESSGSRLSKNAASPPKRRETPP